MLLDQNQIQVLQLYLIALKLFLPVRIRKKFELSQRVPEFQQGDFMVDIPERCNPSPDGG